MSESATPTSGWSIGLGRILGIPVRMHLTFVFLVVWYVGVRAGQGDDPGLSLILLLLMFTCVLLHELGHALMARRFGVVTREIVLYPIGGVARLERMPGGRAELAIALAGPAVNLLLALLLLPLVVLSHPDLDRPLHSPAQLPAWLLLVNVTLFLFNLLPAFPMDGGRVLRAVLSLHMNASRATDIAAAVGQVGAVVLGLLGALTQQIPLLLIAVFIFFGAAQEAGAQRSLAAIRGHSASEAMVTRFETLTPQDSLAHAAESLLATHQQDFPVIDAWQRVVGVLSRAGLIAGLARLGPAAAVLEVMDRDVPTVAPETTLDDVLQRLRERPGRPVMVIAEGRARGMITLDNLAEFIEIFRKT